MLNKEIYKKYIYFIKNKILNCISISLR